MDEPAQAEAYAVADFAEVNQAFVERFLATFPGLLTGALVDLGCGPADILVRLARALPSLTAVGIDGSAAMLAHAEQAVRAAGLSHRIELRQACLPLAEPGPARFDGVISNSLLHHLHQPEVLWREIRRVGRSGSAVLVVDLRRPTTAEAAEALVELYARDERPALKHDFLASLHAAFTAAEVEAQLAAHGLADALRVEALGDRHLVIAGHLP
jgi:ubiquinone/menaquinone biosynthesis C-methylase UbiE